MNKNYIYQLIKNNMKIIGVAIISCFFVLFLATQKEGIHLDEGLSYGLANEETGGGFALPVIDGEKMRTSIAFNEYFCADKLNFKIVWENQAGDVHPPLYYVLLHILCVITGNFLDVKTGIILNLFFHFINILLMKKNMGCIYLFSMHFRRLSWIMYYLYECMLC